MHRTCTTYTQMCIMCIVQYGESRTNNILIVVSIIWPAYFIVQFVSILSVYDAKIR